LPEERPHVLLIICHDLGRRLGCYGVPGLKTPELDALAAAGVAFDRYFATAPLCSPSRGCMLTGRYPHSNGLMGLVNRGWDMPDRSPTLPQLLGAAGYETALFGFHHEKQDPRRMGYTHIWHARGPFHASFLLPRVAEFLRTAGEAPATARPFLCVVGLSEVHRPFRDPRYQPDDPATVAVPGYLPDHPAVRSDLADLHGLIRAVDREMAGVVDALRAGGLWGRTLVAFTTDHGIAFPRAKSTLYDAGLGTVLLLSWPGVLPAGARSGALLSNVDLLPTLLEAAGVPPPDGLEGSSFWGIARNPLAPGAVGRAAVFAEKTYHDAYDPVRAVRTSRWKYIRSFSDQPELLLPADIAASPSATAAEVAAATRRPRAPEELYDLEQDPDELHNLATAPAAAAVRAELHARLERWMVATDDPLRHGPVPGMGRDQGTP
jgi:N-sulfoglucosamine sulfohydrolase